jgi:hypothetical protein
MLVSSVLLTQWLRDVHGFRESGSNARPRRIEWNLLTPPTEWRGTNQWLPLDIESGCGDRFIAMAAKKSILYVGGIDNVVTEEIVFAAFSPFGKNSIRLLYFLLLYLLRSLIPIPHQVT